MMKTSRTILVVAILLVVCLGGCAQQGPISDKSWARAQRTRLLRDLSSNRRDYISVAVEYLDSAGGPAGPDIDEEPTTRDGWNQLAQDRLAWLRNLDKRRFRQLVNGYTEFYCPPLHLEFTPTYMMLRRDLWAWDESLLPAYVCRAASYIARVGGPALPAPLPATASAWRALRNERDAWLGRQSSERLTQLNEEYLKYCETWRSPPALGPRFVGVRLEHKLLIRDLTVTYERLLPMCVCRAASYIAASGGPALPAPLPSRAGEWRRLVDEWRGLAKERLVWLRGLDESERQKLHEGYLKHCQAWEPPLEVMP